jgi:8-oxo-dGTP pyrophosphatase MutT (NUDIX family)
MKSDLVNYPTLNRPITSGTVSRVFVLNPQFDGALVGNVSIVPTVGDQYVVMKLSNGNWELAGGTLEPGESYLECLRREVMEELGAELINYRIFGHFDCINHAAEPYRPHLPFPKFVRIIGTGEVKVVSNPLNPEGGEEVVAVEVVDIEEAVRRYTEIGRLDIAELYWLAHQIRSSAER